MRQSSGLIVSIAALLALSACSSTKEVVGEKPTIQATCEIGGAAGSELVDYDLGTVRVGVTKKIEVLAANEADARRKLRDQGVATRSNPCDRISVRPIGS